MFCSYARSLLSPRIEAMLKLKRTMMMPKMFERLFELLNDEEMLFCEFI